MNVKEIIQEAKSAKEPGRQGFNSLLQKVDEGEADGILCWKLNRLARNPIDGGQIQWRLQNSKVRHIRTFSGNHYPEDNVLQMQVEFGMANQFIKDLSVDVKRGMRQKAERGWYPSRPPLGYLAVGRNYRRTGGMEIVKDPDNFDKVKLLWKELLNGGKTVTQIQKLANDLKITTSHKTGKIPYNTIRNVFNNTFYYGEFLWRTSEGDLKPHQGKHESMITKREFDKVQRLLEKNKHRISEKKKSSILSGCLKCGECQSFYSCDKKHHIKCTNCHFKFSALRKMDCPKCGTRFNKMIDPYQFKATYYRCSMKHKGCSSPRFTEANVLDKIRMALLSSKINEDFLDFIKELWPIVFNPKRDQDEKATIEKTLSDQKKQLEKLEDAYLDGVFSKERFERKRADIMARSKELRQRLDESQELTLDALCDDVLNWNQGISSILSQKA
ncbi:MAG: recombinase family protein, partial [Bacteroidota bacterium]